MKISISTLRMHSKCTYMTLEIWCRFTSSTWLRLIGDTPQPVCISQTGNRLWTTSSNTKFLVNITPQLSKGIISKLYNLLLQNLWSRHRSSFHTYLFYFLSYGWLQNHRLAIACPCSGVEWKFCRAFTFGICRHIPQKF